MNLMLDVKGLYKNFGDFEAVKNLSFTVNEGDVYGFLGQNGAGKSTTLRMLLKLISPSSGKIIFSGKNIESDGNEMLKQTGAIIERPDMYKFLSAYDNVHIFAKLSGIKPTRKLIMDQLEMVGLADRYASKAKTYSQGMKQRLGIAIALIHSPKLIILDEPTNGLDPQGIADMRNLILRLSREMGKTVIVSSHLLSEIEVVANRMIIIHKGQKIVEGNVSTLLDPADTVVEINTTDNDAAFLQLQNTAWQSHLQKTNKTLRLKMNKADVPKIVQTLTGLQVEILSVQPRHSLEEYFLSLTNNDTHVEPFTN
ncbi:MAG: ABC transporter ATP-binding protein [Ferruginibacter sp.]|nr:ABC transporter ATP-binding protein [Ferruginibacter sp.]